MKVLGWSGGSGSYKEVKAPQVSVKIAGADATGLTLKKVLTRTLLCPSANTAAVVQSLQTANVTISAPVPDGAGGTSTVSFGGGWSLVDYAESPVSKFFSELRVQYEKETTSIFDLGLPAGLSMTGENGVGTVSYNGTTLLTFNSGAEESGAGWQLEHIPAFTSGGVFTDRIAPSAPSTAYDTRQSFSGIRITYNRAEVLRFLPHPSDFGTETIQYHSIKVISGNVAEYYSSAAERTKHHEAAALMAAQLGAESATVQTFGSRITGDGPTAGMEAQTLCYVFTFRHSYIPKQDQTVSWSATDEIIELRLGALPVGGFCFALTPEEEP